MDSTRRWRSCSSSTTSTSPLDSPSRSPSFIRERCWPAGARKTSPPMRACSRVTWVFMPNSALLLVDGLHTYYGDSHVLQGVSLEVQPGTVTAVLGRNGVGKTTLCRSLMGLTPARAGRVLLGGSDIARLPPHRIFGMGVSLVPQGRHIFSSLTVQENLAICRRPSSTDQPWDLPKVFELFPRLAERRHHRGNELSGG